MEKIFTTHCMIITKDNVDSNLHRCTITVDSEKVTFSCNYDGEKVYSVPLDFVKGIVKDYQVYGSHTVHETDGIVIHYTKGYLGMNCNHVTMSVHDAGNTLMMSVECSKFDKWIRSQIGKEVKT